MNAAQAISRELKSLANSSKAKVLSHFFKTGKGEYGEGDLFYGVTVPQVRSVAKEYSPQATLSDAEKLLNSKMHEERLAALLVLVDKFAESAENERKEIFSFYLRNARQVNNWDLVDLSADKIVGAYLERKDQTVLKKLATSENTWERRIAIIATFHAIKKGECGQALQICEVLLHDRHDLIHKAVGWMLREIGKRCSQKELEKFLQKHAATMPRTALRYAIEKLPEARRKYYLGLKKV